MVILNQQSCYSKLKASYRCNKILQAKKEANILSNASATIMMNIVFTIGVIFFIIITILAIATRANHHIRSLIIFNIGIIALFAISFAGTQSIEKKDLHQITCKHYDTYAYDTNNKIYTIDNQQFSANGNNDSTPATIQFIATSKKRPRYKAEIVTFSLSKEQKYNYLHSWNLSKQIAAYQNPHEYIINIVKNK